MYFYYHYYYWHYTILLLLINVIRHMMMKAVIRFLTSKFIFELCHKENNVLEKIC